MDYETFEKTVRKIWDTIPPARRWGMSLEIQEDIPPDAEENLFAFFISTFRMVVVCYWGFKNYGDFSYDHIKRVVEHEVEHAHDKSHLLAKKEELIKRKRDFVKQHQHKIDIWKIRIFILIITLGVIFFVMGLCLKSWEWFVGGIGIIFLLSFLALEKEPK